MPSSNSELRGDIPIGVGKIAALVPSNCVSPQTSEVSLDDDSTKYMLPTLPFLYYAHYTALSFRVSLPEFEEDSKAYGDET